MQTICPECGHTFDGDQCWVCVNRKEDIDETISLSTPVAGAGIVTTILAIGLYPPLKLNPLVIYMTPLAIVIPGAIAFVLLLCDRFIRYAVFVRILFVLVAAGCITPAAYYFLNGILDGNPPVETPAIVSDRYVSHGEYGGDDLVLNLPAKQGSPREQIGVRVDDKTYSAVKIGDSVRITIHPGAFSTPWYGVGILSTGHDAVDSEQNRQFIDDR